MEDHVEQQKNDQEDDWQNEFEPLLGAQLELVFSRPAICKPSRHFQLLAQQAICLCDETPVVGCVEVDVDVTRQLSILVANHGGSARKRKFCNFPDGDLRSPGSRDDYSFQLSYVVAEVPVVPHVNRKSLPAFHVLGNIRSTDTRRHGSLHICDGESIAGGLSSIHLDIDVKSLGDTLCKY